MKKYVIAAVLAAAFAGSADAQNNPTFTGLRVEGLIGYDKVGIEGIKDPDGLLYGVGVGYDFAAGGLLIGVEGEAADSTAKVKLVGPDLQASRDLYAGARVGKVVGDKGLLYIKGGYTNARFKVKGLGSDKGDGFRIGGGYEQAISANTFVKAEYRYSDYEGDVTRHQIVAGFGFRF